MIARSFHYIIVAIGASCIAVAGSAYAEEECPDTIALLREADDATVRRLMHSDDDSTALAARWELLLRELAMEEPQYTDEDVPEEESLEAERQRATTVSRFLGFLEGRLKVSPLPEWEQVVFSVRAWKGESPLEGEGEIRWMKFDPKPVRELFGDGTGVRTLRSQAFQSTDGSYVLHIENDRVPLPEKTFQRWRFYTAVVGVIRDDVCVVILPWVIGRFPVVCIDRKTGKVLWEAEATTLSGGTVSGIPDPTFNVPVIDGSYVYVYGAARSTVYLEVFQLKDGKRVVEFHSDHFY